MDIIEVNNLLSRLNWTYTETVTAALYEMLSEIDLEIDQAVIVGTKYNAKPTAQVLAKTLKSIERKNKMSDNVFDERFNMEIKAKKLIYNVVMLTISDRTIEKIIRHNIIWSFATTTFDYKPLFDKYLRELSCIKNKALYEICYIFIEYNGYEHHLDFPEKILFPKMWENYKEDEL
jgi:hypothetical protein